MEMEINVVAIEVPSAESMREIARQRNAEIMEQAKQKAIAEMLRYPEIFANLFEKVLNVIADSADNGYTTATITIGDYRFDFKAWDWNKVESLIMDALTKSGYKVHRSNYSDSWKRKSGKEAQIYIKW